MSAQGQEPESAAPSAPEPTTPEPTTPPPSDGLDRVYARMDEFAAQQARLAESFQQYMAPPEEEPDESDFYTDEGELTEEGARAVIADLVREQIQSEMAPREKARAVEMRDDAYEALRDQYPELQDDKVAEQVLGSAIRWAQANDPAVIESPAFVDVIEFHYKAGKFDELASQRAAEQPRSVVLESAQGARQQQRPNEPDWSDRIVKAAERLRPQI
jgi:polyhydroxyalkanoate synthesis regulator phasin